MKLQLEQVGEDTVLVLPPEFLTRLGLNEGDELIATVDGRDLLLTPAGPAKGGDETAAG
jgi:bifunctional DNA-binding transcriptional regulator/antitoxin component of YhaV-PrlF toxin-antitoxin module